MARKCGIRSALRENQFTARAQLPSDHFVCLLAFPEARNGVHHAGYACRRAFGLLDVVLGSCGDSRGEVRVCIRKIAHLHFWQRGHASHNLQSKFSMLRTDLVGKLEAAAGRIRRAPSKQWVLVFELLSQSGTERQCLSWHSSTCEMLGCGRWP